MSRLAFFLDFSAALSWTSVTSAQNYYLDASTTFVRAVVSVETSALSNPTWQAFAARTGVLLADTGDSPSGRLAALATATGRPEVAVAPFVPFGLSANARRALQTGVAQPARCIAILAQRPGRCFATGNEEFNFNRLDQTVSGQTLFDYSPAFSVPALFMAGELDNLSGIVPPLGNCEFGRQSGNAPWAFALEPNVTHTGAVMPPALVTIYLEGILARRLPAANWPANESPALLPIDLTTGWLANPTTREVARWADFSGDRSKAAWLPDEATVNAWLAATTALPFTIPAQPISLPASVSNLEVLDPTYNTIHPSDQAGGTSGGAAWKVCGNFKVADQPYVVSHGSAIFTIPNSVRGADWIRPMEDVRTSTVSPLLRFTVTANATVYVAHDAAIATKPSWLSTWTDTGEDITLTTGNTNFTSPRTLRLFSRAFAAGSSVELGPNGGNTNQVMYLTLVKADAPPPANAVFLVASDATAAEAGLDPASVTVSRSGTSGNLTVNYETGGSAQPLADYAQLAGSIVIPDGQSSATISLVPLQDTEVEGTESATISLLPDAAYTIGEPGSVTISLLDDDGAALPAVSISSDVSSITEGPSAVVTLTLTRTGSTADALPVTLSVTGDAAYESDYTAFSLNQSIPAGSASTTIAIAVPDDGLSEGSESLIVTVIPTSSYTLGVPESVSVTLGDPVAPPPGISPIGVRFISNNQGGLRNVLIRSSDPASTGIGLDLANGLNGPLLVKDLVVEGFRIGIQAGNALNSATLENITLRDQLEAGIYNVQQVLTIRGLLSEQSQPIPALINGEDPAAAAHWFGLVTLVESSLHCTADPMPDHAIFAVGNMCVHNVEISGYRIAARQLYANFSNIPSSDLPLSGQGIPLWLKAHNTVNASTFQPATFPDAFTGIPSFEVLATPDVPWDDPADWVSLATYAAGDGVTDDTAAFQAAIDSMKPGGVNHGKTTLYLPAGPQFRIVGTVDISGPVRRIIGLKGRVLGEAVGRLRLVDSSGSEAASDAPVVRIERLNGFSNQFYIEHASKRTLAVANTTGVRFVGSGTGDLFIEDVAGGNHVFNRPWQRVWARQFNAENSQTKIDNAGAVLWILGLKTEKSRTVLDTRNGAISSILGAFIYRVDEATANPDPLFRVTDASAYFFGVGEYDATGSRHYTNILSETRGTETRNLARTDFTGGGRHNGSRIVYLTNAAAADVPPPFTLWTNARLGAGATPDLLDDSDGDSLGLLLKYILGGDPASPDRSAVPRLEAMPDGSARFVFSLPSDGRTDSFVTLEEAIGSLGAGAWQTSTRTPVLTPDPAAGRTTVTYTIPQEIPTPFFLRLRGELNPR